MGRIVIPNSIAGPMHASKYFSRSRRDTLWSSRTLLCLWNDAHADRFRLENSILARDEADDDNCFPKYLCDSSSSNILTNSHEISVKFKVESSSDGLHLRILIFLAFSVKPIFRSSSINFPVISSSSFSDFA